MEEDLRKQISVSNKSLLATLPRLPTHVGGEVELMLGKAYLKYYPKEVARLDSGLTIYEAIFPNLDGSKGVICGPHPEFLKTDRSSHFVQPQLRYTYLSTQARHYDEQISMITDAPLLGMSSADHADLSECEHKNGFDIYASRRAPKCLKVFNDLEATGTDVSYRCPDCRKCVNCKNGPTMEAISIQEEMEQELINKAVTVDVERRVSESSLPFIGDPATKLSPNSHAARKLYDRQVRSLAKSPSNRQDALASEAKLQELGFVDYLENLPVEDRELVLNSGVKYFMPWHAVRSHSISTPVRIVFNCSHKTPNGSSLNDILAKGIISLNNLVEILIRWTIRGHGYHTDIRKKCIMLSTYLRRIGVTNYIIGRKT